MQKSIYSPRVDLFCARLIELRSKAGMTQRDLASKLKVHHSTIGRMEVGERRVDVVELYLLLEALEVDPEKEFRSIAKSFSNL